MSIGSVTYQDYYNLAACATGASINRADNMSELGTYLLGGSAIMALPLALKAGKGLVWDMPKYFYKNGFSNLYKDTLGKTNFNPANRALLKGNFRGAVGDAFYRNQIANLNIPKFDMKQLLQNPTKNASIIQEAKCYEKVSKLVAEAKSLTGKQLAEKTKEILDATTEAKIAVNNAKATGAIVSSSKIGKLFSTIKTKTGISAVQNKILQGTMSKNALVRAGSKAVKAGGGMAVISAIFEAPNVYRTYKELGAKKGTKQLAKSTVNVLAETAGYVAGAKIGGIAGAKIGATIGTCIGGPIGTAVGGAIGSVIGVACGILGSWLAGKASRAIVGKDELEIAQEEQTTALAKEAKDNKELQLELLQNAEQNLSNGNFSEADAQAIAQSYNRLAQNFADNSGEQQVLSATTRTATSSTNTQDAGLLALTQLAGGYTASPYSYPIGGAMNFNYYGINNPFLQQNSYMFNNMYNPFLQYPAFNTVPFINQYGTM